MTKDYKHRTSRKAYRQANRVSIWRWLVAAGLVGLFITFLMFLKNPQPPAEPAILTLKNPAPKKHQPGPESSVKKSKPEPTSETPHFEFYTILPEQEVEIPETEIKTRKSEEKQGKVRPGSYVLQVGSFRNFKDADRLKAELAMHGIHSKIETARLGDAIWNRVKIGPYTSMTAVDVVRKRLRLQNIDSVVVSVK